MNRIRNQHRNVSRRLVLVALALAVSLGAATSEADDRPARIREAATRAAPAVVSIRPAGIVVAPPIVPPIVRFGRPPFRLPGPVIEEQGPSVSGVIVDAKRGIVLTSASGLRGASRADIRLPDGAVRESRRIAFGDPRDGLALIEFDPQGAALAQVEWGDSEALRLGDDVLAVGRSARGELLASPGIVAMERRKAEAGSESAPIVTDALITPETGGGPLLDLNGRVVGICQLDGPTPLGEPRAGYRSAAPAALARAAVDELAAGTPRRRGYLGVVLGNVVGAPGQPIGEARGVVVTGVAPGSPAAEAGIEPGDRILAVDGRAVPDAAALSRAVENAPVGSDLTLRIERRGEEIEIKARTRADVALPGSPEPRPSSTPTPTPEPDLKPSDENGKPSRVEEQSPSTEPSTVPDEPESKGR